MPHRSPPTTRAKAAWLVAGAVASALAALGYARLFAVAGAPDEPDEGGEVATEVPVHVAKIERATLHRYVEAYGSVVPDAAHDGLAAAGAKLATPVAGVLTEVRCAEGQRVQAGEALFQLDARPAAAEEQRAAAAAEEPRAALPRLAAELDLAERERQRTEVLAKQALASDKELAEAELRVTSARSDLAEAKAKAAEAERALAAARLSRALTTVRAPLAGTVLRVHVRAGEAVDTATVLADVVDLARLVVEAPVPAADLPSVAAGQAVWLDAAGRAKDAAPSEEAAANDAGEAGFEAGRGPREERVRGVVRFVGLDVDPKTDTGWIRVALPEGAALRPGQYVRVEVVVEEREGRLAVPAAAVVDVPGQGPSIAIVEGERARRHRVTMGLRERGLVEIQGDGVAEGLTVATAGSYGLPEETRVRVVDP